MNRTKVVKAISMHRARKAGKLSPHGCMPDSEIDYMAHAIEALEEIASEANIEALKEAIDWMGEKGIVCTELVNLRAKMISIQVPKEIVYAYPVTMERHFLYYCDKYYQGGIVSTDGVFRFKANETDDFGCSWRHFGGPKELVNYLRDNNVPIKVIE